jgi:menaquinone-dependent protoporphyrinogen oxidase
MSEILVLYASTHGHTSRIAAGIAQALERAGAHADLRTIALGDDVTPLRYDAVVVGASVHAGRHQKPVADWARRYADALNAMPSAFFSVSLTAADDTGEARATTARLIGEFAEATGWRPRMTRSFAGALQYREYRLFTRFVMKMMMRRGEHPTDTSRDYDYTDWDAVDAFGGEVAAMVPAPTAAAPAAAPAKPVAL